MVMPIRARYIDGRVDYGMPRTYSMCTQCHELEGSQMCLIVRPVKRNICKIDLLRILPFTLERINMKGNPNMNGYVPLVLPYGQCRHKFTQTGASDRAVTQVRDWNATDIAGASI